MSLYGESTYPVSEALAGLHDRQFEHIVSPGTWYTGAQRRAIAATARSAAFEAGLLEPASDPAEATNVDLPDIARRVAATIATSVVDLNEAFYENAAAEGLRDVEYVEITGVVARLVDLDVFARGIGVAPRPLPPVRTGAPSRTRPDTAVVEHAWVATIPNGREGGAVGESLYHGHPMPYIVRALSLVPDELRAHVELEIAHYTRLDKLFDYEYQHHNGLSRPQAEVVAGRVSALNDCFY
jgi:hypothetical protein